MSEAEAAHAGHADLIWSMESIQLAAVRITARIQPDALEVGGSTRFTAIQETARIRRRDAERLGRADRAPAFSSEIPSRKVVEASLRTSTRLTRREGGDLMLLGELVTGQVF